MGAWVESRHTTPPVSASSPSTSPFRSPVKTRPPAVGVTAATSGVGDLYFHRTRPVSASTAVNQPPHISFGSLRPKRCSGSPDPDHAAPGLPTAKPPAATLTEELQSAALTKNSLSASKSAGPVHSVASSRLAQKPLRFR